MGLKKTFRYLKIDYSGGCLIPILFVLSQIPDPVGGAEGGGGGGAVGAEGGGGGGAGVEGGGGGVGVEGVDGWVGDDIVVDDLLSSKIKYSFWQFLFKKGYPFCL